MNTRNLTSEPTVSALAVLQAIRDGQASEMSTVIRCRAELQEIAVDDRLDGSERLARIRHLQRLRNQAHQALRELEDDELVLVAESDYAKDAVNALKDAAQRLEAEVGHIERISSRVTVVAGAIDGVTHAADAVLSRVIKA